MTTRQHVSVGVHLSEQHGAFKPTLYPATVEQVIARIDLIDGLAIQSADPRILRTIADLCVRAANTIEAALAEQHRRDMADDMRFDAQAEADAEARALGYHDADCQAEIEHDAMLDEIAVAG